MLIIRVESEVGDMPRPCCRRRVAGEPVASIFKPAGVPARELDVVRMTLDELEAIRLADLEGLYQEQAAEQMHVSRPTLGRILESARRKVAEALVRGLSLKIEGGPIFVDRRRRRRCGACKLEWEPPSEEAGRPRCPYCQSDKEIS
jgi:predicted DNA-binding protein (UPF0251 family)